MAMFPGWMWMETAPRLLKSREQPGGRHLQFGDFGPVNGEGTIEYTFVRWTADGAFAP